MLIIIVIHERRDNMPPFNEISIRSVIDFLLHSTFVNDIQPYINIIVFLEQRVMRMQFVVLLKQGSI